MGINLLPLAEQKKNYGAYYARLGGAALAALAIVFFVGVLLLLPIYFISEADANAEATYLAASGGSASTTQTSSLVALGQFTERVSILKTYTRVPIVARVFSALTEGLPKGVYLSTITVTPAANGGTVSVSGSAGTRGALLAYVTLLQKVSLFSAVTLPVSSLADESNVPFSLTFNLAPQ